MPVKTFSKIQLMVLFTVAGSALNGHAEPAKAPVRTGPIKSVFVMPTSPKEGRDPFFPDSTRVYETTAAATAVAAAATVHGPEITNLKVKGYSVMNGRAMVIINNHAFMVNDEGDVLTLSGRVHIRCMEIRPGLAIIQVNGQRMDLHF